MKCHIRRKNCLPLGRAWIYPLVLVGFVLLIFLACCVVLCALFVFILCLVYSILRVSLGCPFLIAPSVFSKVYLKRTLHENIIHKETYKIQFRENREMTIRTIISPWNTKYYIYRTVREIRIWIKPTPVKYLIPFIYSNAGNYHQHRHQREVIRIRKSKKNRQHNGQKKKDKRTNNLQNITHKTKDRVTRTPLNPGWTRVIRKG